MWGIQLRIRICERPYRCEVWETVQSVRQSQNTCGSTWLNVPTDARSVVNGSVIQAILQNTREPTQVSNIQLAVGDMTMSGWKPTISLTLLPPLLPPHTQVNV